jgi:hypothetical protein
MKNRNLTVIAVSIDQAKKEWLEAVEKDRLSCINVSDPRGWKSLPILRYHVNAIPYHILIAPDGKLLARGENADKLIKPYINKM